MPGGFFSRSEIENIVARVRSPHIRFGAGKVIFVDGISGADSNPPDDPAKPLKTIAYALGLCRNDKDDYIVVLDCYQQEASWPIVVDKSRVHIIGLDVGNGKFPRMAPPGDTAVFQVGDKGYFEIAGFSLGAGAAHACIEVEAGGVEARGILHDLWLGWTESGQDGILVPDNTDAPELEIADSFFGSGLTRDGVRLAGNSTRGIIRRNLFNKVGGIGINALKAGSDIRAILSNVFRCADAADGEAITLAAGVGNAVIDDNRAAEGAVAMTNNPYRDLSGSLNAWGANYRSNALILPAVV